MSVTVFFIYFFICAVKLLYLDLLLYGLKLCIRFVRPNKRISLTPVSNGSGVYSYTKTVRLYG